MVERYLEWTKIKAYSEETTKIRRQSLSRFLAWCEEREIGRASEITKPILESYQRYLYNYRKKDGRELTISSRYAHVVSLCQFFRYLSKYNLILFNPASELELPKVRIRLPNVLSVAEVEQVLSRIDVKEPLGLRNRAMLETLYSTGMRRAELMHLQVHDLDAQRGVVLVRLGKGGRDRMLPIGERALAWVEKYLAEARPLLVVRHDEQTLFLSSTGEAFGPESLTRLVHRHVLAAGIKKGGSCHIFRHSMATLMLENGADIRFIQQMLGHARLSTTQVYTQVSIRALKEVHTATHPARLKRTRKEPAAEGTSAGEDSKIEESKEAIEDEELFSSLAAEDEED